MVIVMVGMTGKVLVLGLDGASPLLVDRWIEGLSNFRRFRDEGVFGLSIPPSPAQTPVAWTTFMTGKNPGKHGIFSFAQRSPGSYGRRIIRPELIRSRTLWEILSHHGKRVGVINVPMSTYNGFSGFMVPGFLDRMEGVPQPSKIREKIVRRFGRGRVVGDVDLETLRRVRSDPDHFIERVYAITDELADISLYLLGAERWDFFMTVFMGTDRLGHFFWKYVDRNHPNYTLNGFNDRVRGYYRMIDDIIARLLEAIPEETLVILLSDHGFCPVSREVFLNNYLQEFGYLESTNGKVNLEKSRAIAHGYGDIWLNVEGREPSGLVEEGREYEDLREGIIESLEGLRIDGEGPVQRVVRREEVYWGPYVAEASDLIAVFNRGWQAARRPEILNKRRDGRYVNDDPLWSGGHDGTHDPREVPGVLGFLGPDVIRGSSPLRAHLWDLAPTILRAMNIPVPGDMDGRVLPCIR
ncbi:MAG: alkaline phosphatase family protein [Candidatus Bathyarchaeia archaeon]